jgi:hypothetical protein
VSTAPDPDDADLARLAVEPVLGDIRDRLTTQRAENQLWEPGERTSHQVLSVEMNGPGTAVLRDCVVEDDTLLDGDDGSVVRTTALTTRIVHATLKLVDGEWAVSVIGTVDKFDGEVPCDG